MFLIISAYDVGVAVVGQQCDVPHMQLQYGNVDVPDTSHNKVLNLSTSEQYGQYRSSMQPCLSPPYALMACNQLPHFEIFILRFSSFISIMLFVIIS